MVLLRFTLIVLYFFLLFSPISNVVKKLILFFLSICLSTPVYFFTPGLPKSSRLLSRFTIVFCSWICANWTLDSSFFALEQRPQAAGYGAGSR